jgi:sugar phosphate permease
MVIVFFCILVTYGLTMLSFGVFLKPITVEMDWDRGALSGALSLSIVVGGGIGILAGRLTDRYGPRPIIRIGALLTGMAFLLMSQISTLWHAYLILGILRGLGTSFSLLPVAVVIPRWFVKRRGIAMGLAMSGIGLGGIIAPLLTQWLISTSGWRNAFIIIGSITIIIIIPLAQLLKHNPQQAGLKPYGEDEIIENKSARSSAIDGLSLRQAIRTRGFWLFGLIQTFAHTSMVAVMIHIAPHANDIGIPPATAAGILSFIAGAGIVGRLAFGFISDRIGGKRVLTICLSLLTTALILLLFAREIWMFYVFAIIFGLANGGFTTLIPVVTAELFGLISLGTIIGGVGIFGRLGEALGAPLSGSIFDITGNYRLAFLISIGICALAVIISLVLLKYKGKSGIVKA